MDGFFIQGGFDHFSLKMKKLILSITAGLIVSGAGAV
jgi:hypothetical protein